MFFGNGMHCPLTALAARCGAEKGHAFDTLLPESLTRHTFCFFGTPYGPRNGPPDPQTDRRGHARRRADYGPSVSLR